MTTTLPSAVILDIETHACGAWDVAWLAQVAALSVYPGAPKNYTKPETIAKHRAEWEEGLTERLEEKRADTALNPLLGYISCVGLMFLDSSGNELETMQYTASCVDEEAEMLAATIRMIQQVPVVYTFNGKRFDLPYLMTRAAVHGMVFPMHLNPTAYNNPAHTDLAFVLPLYSGPGMPYSAQMYAAAFNLSTAPDPLTGAQCATCDDLELIKQHNFADLFIARQLVLRFAGCEFIKIPAMPTDADLF